MQNEKLTESEMLEIAELDLAIAEAEKEYTENGEMIDARQALSDLRRKYFAQFLS